jgi:hypothetical protein
MPTLNYSFEELWGNNGEGTSSISLTAGTDYNFLITSSIGTGYLTLETVRDYDGVTPKNTSGSYTSVTNIASSVISDYIAGFSVPQGFSSFVYTPASNVVGSTLKLRGVGGVILGSGNSAPTIPTYTQNYISSYKTTPGGSLINWTGDTAANIKCLYLNSGSNGLGGRVLASYVPQAIGVQLYSSISPYVIITDTGNYLVLTSPTPSVYTLANGIITAITSFDDLPACV